MTVRSALTGWLTALLLTACFGGGSDDPPIQQSRSVAPTAPATTATTATATTATMATEPPLVELPVVGTDLPASSSSSPTETAAATTVPSTVAEPATAIALGTWDWGVPCRVPVRELIGGVGPQIERLFTISLDVDPASGGYLLSFVDVVEQRRGLDDEFIDRELYRYLAALPDIRLDVDGRFVEFVDLDATLITLTERAADASMADVESLVGRTDVIDAVLDRTVLGWYGFWLEEQRIPSNPERMHGSRVRPGASPGASVRTELFAAPIDREGVWGPQPDGAVWLVYTEQATESTGRVDVSAIVDRSNRRPTYVSLDIEAAASGTVAGFATRERRIVTFDWADAAGCA